MFIGMPKCTFKCDNCQNKKLNDEKNIVVQPEDIVLNYINNPITEAIVFGGLEPFDTFDDLFTLIKLFRKYTHDDIVIYTGYYKEEIQEYLLQLLQFNNIIIKYGRYDSNSTPVYNDILGVKLASTNQYVEVLT